MGNEIVGNNWNHDKSPIVKIDDRMFVLFDTDWNGEVWSDCPEVLDIHGHETTGKQATIRPIYTEIDDDEFEITDYQIV